MKSLRLFLVAGAIAILILFNFVAALRGYQSSMREAELLFDNQLLDLSLLVANLDTGRVTKQFRLGNNLAFQVWKGPELVAASYHAPVAAIGAFTPGFDYANFDGYRWRTYTRRDAGTGHWIIVAERSDLRFLLAENVVLESIAPMLIGIPLAGLLIWVVVSFAMKPLRVLSDDLRARRVHDPRPLPPRETPCELDQVVESVNGFIQRLGAALEREQRFSADAAHELRTPIGALKIQLHNLAQEIDTRSPAFVQLQQGVDRMQHLVEQLLSLYRSTPDQFAANCARLDLRAVAQDVVARLYPLIERKQQTLELEGDAQYVTGERFALETMIENLVSNASRYTPARGRILLKLERNPHGVCFTVEDDGPGIPEAERERVFERFFRSGTTGEGDGCGLGLTIVRHVAELHRASVSVGSSSFGRGAAFTVCFPESGNA